MTVINRKTAHKFRAKPTCVDSFRFDSKLESQYYQKLKVLQSSGKVLFFLRQVPFHIPGGIKYICDFQVFYEDGSIDFIDVKGVDTVTSKMKRKLVEYFFPVTITIVQRL